MRAQNGSDVTNQIIAIIPAAGSGTRMGLQQAKQFADLGGRPILEVTLSRFQECDLVDKIILVVSQQDIDYCTREIIERYKLSKVYKVIAGGKRRQDSVRKGLESITRFHGLVLIHDGVRPFVSSEFLKRIITAGSRFRAVIAGLPVKETIKEVDSKGWVVKSIQRKHVWSIQTPQIFRYDDINRAHQQALRHRWEEATDDALLLEKMGIPVTIIEGKEHNIKITTPQDIEIARLLISKKSS